MKVLMFLSDMMIPLVIFYIVGFGILMKRKVIVKMFSSSAAVGLLLDIYKEYGADSTVGYGASLILSSTETIFYTMSVYFMAAKVTKTRWTLAGSLLATAAGVAASIFLAGRM